MNLFSLPYLFSGLIIRTMGGAIILMYVLVYQVLQICFIIIIN